MRCKRWGVLIFVFLSVITAPAAWSQNSTTPVLDTLFLRQNESSSPSSAPEDAGTVTADSTAASDSSAHPFPVESETADETAAIPETDAQSPPSDLNPVPDETSPESIVSPIPPASAIREPENAPPTGDSGLVRAGIGVQCGVRFHRPDAFNHFVTDLWNSVVTEYGFLPANRKSIGPGVLLTLTGAIDIGPFFLVTPFAQGAWAGKQFYFRGGLVKDIFANTYTATGGLNLWIRIVNLDKIAVRLGAGGYGAYTIARITGDVPKIILSGSGYGFKGLLGTEIRLRPNVTATLECSVPYGTSKLVHRTDTRDVSAPPVRYPAEFTHRGFEVCPGILFYF